MVGVLRGAANEFGNACRQCSGTNLEGGCVEEVREKSQEGLRRMESNGGEMGGRGGEGNGESERLSVAGESRRGSHLRRL